MSSLHELAAKRVRLGEAIRAMTESQQYMPFFSASGIPLLRVCGRVGRSPDGCRCIRIGLSAGDARAAAAFRGIDRDVDQANKLLTAFGGVPIQKKELALEALDPSLRKVGAMTQQVQQVRGWLKKLGIREGHKTACPRASALARSYPPVLSRT